MYRVFEDRISAAAQEETNPFDTRFVIGRKIEKITKRAAALLHKAQYIFVEEEQIWIEQMLNFNPQDNSFTCYNRDIGDVFSIELSRIRELFLVEAVIDLRNYPPPPHHFLRVYLVYIICFFFSTGRPSSRYRRRSSYRKNIWSNCFV